MSDIVERLREAAASLSEIYPDYAEAADEISRLRADLAAITAECDALLARLAPVDDEALAEIAADAISTYVPDQVSKWGSIKDAAIDALAAIRPHIEAAERKRCERIVDRYKNCLPDVIPQIVEEIRRGE